MTGREREEVWGGRDGVEKGTRGMAMERVRKEGSGERESGSSYVVWEAPYQPTNVSFCKALCMFWVFFFCLIHQKKYSGDSGRERRDHELNVLSKKKKKPSTSAVNDMHLIPMRPNKAVTERFHALISSGLCEGKKKGMIAASIWVFQCVVFVAVQFLFFFLFLFARNSRSSQRWKLSNWPPIGSNTSPNLMEGNVSNYNFLHFSQFTNLGCDIWNHPNMLNINVLFRVSD